MDIRTQPLEHFRIHLSSADAVPGSTLTNAAFNVHLDQHVPAGRVKVTVESWNVTNASLGGLSNVVYRVGLRELPNRSSFASFTQAFADTLLVTSGYHYAPRPQCGTVVPGEEFFSRRLLSVYITCPPGYAWNVADTWELVLSVAPV